MRRSGSQSKVLLDAKAQKAENSGGRDKVRQAQREEQLREQLGVAKAQRDRLRRQQLVMGQPALRGGICLQLEGLALPWLNRSPITMNVRSGERWRLKGANGSGKSTLLKVIAARLAPLAGRCRVRGRCLYLDQDFSLLDERASAVDNLHRLHPTISRSTWRTWLGSVRLRGDKALMPVAALSGGERLKVALLAVTQAEQAPDLLLLDEPDNHLDLDSRELLEDALSEYPGALMLVSHDETFVQAVGVSHQLDLSEPAKK
ncbi:hypothetical protein CAI21_16045 [Alkalilimnicola ehrlichii]|uniref:ATP-binding cassette domain-containing protein n=1 Tax=Alkalilimnicola ehrlichii TaxID=351052 RepID=UPI000E2EE287|nr:ATP-binding cassette domain-containing protein [Alkalilimnicola ehrlichii]RFA26793.1 hypothetical protein CAI21_16045 [Alkalilimnicola ehrlichii]